MNIYRCFDPCLQCGLAPLQASRLVSRLAQSADSARVGDRYWRWRRRLPLPHVTEHGDQSAQADTAQGSASVSSSATKYGYLKSNKLHFNRFKEECICIALFFIQMYSFILSMTIFCTRDLKIREESLYT